MSEKSLDELKTDLSLRAKKGLGFIGAGGTYWLLMTGVGALFPLHTAALTFLLAMGIVFPLAYLYSQLIDGWDLAPDNPLSALGGQIAALNGFFLPVMIVVYATIPEWTPFTMAVLGGAHFLPYAWLYDSTGYLVLALTLSLGAAVATFLLNQFAALESTFVVIPLVGVGAHVASGVIVRREVAELESSTDTSTASS